MIQNRERISGAVRSSAELLGRSRRAGLKAGRLLLSPLLIATDMTGRVPFRQHQAERLRKEQPLHNAMLGQQDIRKGAERDDEELANLGQAMMVRAVITSAQDPEVPAHVMDRTARMVLDEGFDVASAPYLDPGRAQFAAKIVDSYRPVTHQDWLSRRD